MLMHAPATHPNQTRSARIKFEETGAQWSFFSFSHFLLNKSLDMGHQQQQASEQKNNQQPATSTDEHSGQQWRQQLQL
jgi:hypothetical protein